LGATGEYAVTAGGRNGAATAIETMRKRSVVIAGHRTSVSLETAFWAGLKEIADQRGVSVNHLVEVIDSARATNLSSAIRVFVLQQFRSLIPARMPH